MELPLRSKINSGPLSGPTQTENETHKQIKENNFVYVLHFLIVYVCTWFDCVLGVDICVFLLSLLLFWLVIIGLDIGS